MKKQQKRSSAYGTVLFSDSHVTRVGYYRPITNDSRHGSIFAARRGPGYILTADQSVAGSAGILSRRTNQSQGARVYSHDGPITNYQAGADPRARSASGATPLHFAAVAGRVEVVRALVEAGGADPHAEDVEGGTTPLHWAAGAGHRDVVRVLVSESTP
eukprot:1195808-Prorocentrum_minimum.AAC.1